MADRYDHETLLAYVEGELSDEGRARFEAQLAEDAELRRLVEGMLRDRTALHDLPKEAPPPAMVDDAIQQLEREMLLGAPSDEPIPIESRRRPPRRHRVFKTLAYSGIAAIMLLSGGIILMSLTGTNAVETARRIVQLDRNDSESAEVAEPSAPDDAEAPGDVALNGGRSQDGQANGSGGGLAFDAPGRPGERGLALDGAEPSADALAQDPGSLGDDAFAEAGEAEGDAEATAPGAMAQSEAEPPQDVTDPFAEYLRWPDGLDLNESAADSDPPAQEPGDAMAMRERQNVWMDDDLASTSSELTLEKRRDGAPADATADEPTVGSELARRSSRLREQEQALAGPRDARLEADVADLADGPTAAARERRDASETRRRASAVQMVVASADVLQTQAELMAWAGREGVAVQVDRTAVEPFEQADQQAQAERDEEQADAAAPEDVQPAESAEARQQAEREVGQTAAAGERPALRMQVEPTQLVDLLARLNRDGDGQRAKLILDEQANLPAWPMNWRALTGDTPPPTPLRPPQPEVPASSLAVEVVIVPQDEP